MAQRTNSAGTVTSSDLYDGFGKLMAGGTVGDAWGFGAQAGYYTVNETGLLLTHRYYDPTNGRFLTRDPISYNGGINLYGYTQNDPVSRVDPLGYDFWGGVGEALLGVGIGFVAGAVIAATAPAWVVVGIAVAATAVGGFMIGQEGYEFATGEDWSTGAQLSQDDRGTRGGEFVVGIATIGLSSCKWSRLGSEKDMDWLKMPPMQRWADDNGNATTSSDLYNANEGLPAYKRPIRPILDWNWWNLGTTWSSGATSGIRGGYPGSIAGAGESRRAL